MFEMSGNRLQKLKRWLLSLFVVVILTGCSAASQLSYSFRVVEPVDQLPSKGFGYAWVCGDNQPPSELIDNFEGIYTFSEVTEFRNSERPRTIALSGNDSECTLYFETFGSVDHYVFDVRLELSGGDYIVRVFDFAPATKEHIFNLCTVEISNAPKELDCSGITTIEDVIVVFSHPISKLNILEGRSGVYSEPINKGFVFTQGVLFFVTTMRI